MPRLYGAFSTAAYKVLVENVNLSEEVRVYLALQVYARPTSKGPCLKTRAKVSQRRLGELAFGPGDGSEYRAHRALRKLTEKGLVRVVKQGTKGDPAEYEFGPDGTACAQATPERAALDVTASRMPCGKACAPNASDRQADESHEKEAEKNERDETSWRPDSPLQGHDLSPGRPAWGAGWR